MVNYLRKNFSTLTEAEVHYNLSLSDYLGELVPSENVPAKKKTGHDKCTQTSNMSDDSRVRSSSTLLVAIIMEASTQTTCTTEASTQTMDECEESIPATASENTIVELSVNVADRNLLLLLSQLCRCFGVTSLLDLLAKLTKLLPRNELIVCADEIFLHLADLQGETCNPVNYVSLSLEAMKTLSVISKSSLVCKFVHMLGTKRPGSEEPLIPIDRMPFGLIQYQIEFFSSTNVMQVQIYILYIMNIITPLLSPPSTLTSYGGGVAYLI